MSQHFESENRQSQRPQSDTTPLQSRRSVTAQRILRYPEDEAALRQKSVKVGRIDDDIRALVADLLDTLAANPGAGLAAPQIGVHKRVTIVRFGQDNEPRDGAERSEMEPPLALINPEIVKAGVPARGFDGCLSIPNLLTWSTVRPSVLTFRALGVDGKPIRRTVKGIDARLVHHEIDHLDGILFLDRLKDLDDLFIVKHDENGKPRLVPVNNPTARPPVGPYMDIGELKL